MLRNNRGFTLPELLIVMGILGILAHMALLTYMDSMAKASDAAAITDARNLVTVATQAFATGENPDFSHAPGMGRSVGLKTDGGYIFSLSQNVEVLIGSSEVGARHGFVDAIIFSARGTPDASGIGGRRNFYCVVDELNSVIIAPSF